MLTFSQGSLSVTLRDPDFGDTDSIESRRVQRKTRGGDLILYRDPMWPKTETFTFQFSYLNRQDLMNLLYFIEATLGQNVTLTDYNGRTFTGIIMTPAAELAQAGIENFTTKLSFQVQL